MKTIHSITPGKIVYLNSTTGLMGIETRLGDRILVPIAWSEAETLNVVVHSINDQPISVQDLSVWMKKGNAHV